ncbi:FAD/NAD(P)-binding protein [Glarea lozoyensis ATCC 20868]|uniref:FAD/NAD(P)-binding protein n=1 Tax=Glarea lozoyensis (strain ATCC 20868 / MF5171) TaxID=1116229 RepID=S3DV44_GLAL2|nr:FAD/NAD(P)-binding protein [Glarea lozoyensis ATCC 20868]EPE30263.1 FAD/NAD(P)-binding protein [Glarea lozoyensis ATCC 20868]
MSESKSIHIAIVGGGIGGVVLAIALSKFPNLTFTIFESRSAFGEIGAGLGFGANSHLAMKLISPLIWKNYKKRASFNGWPEKEDVWFDFTVGEKGEGWEGKRIAEVKMEDGVTQSTCHRAHFLEELVRLLPEGYDVQFNKKLVGVDQSSEKVSLKFADGTESFADAVVGCDGIRSATRGFVYDDPKLVSPRFTGKVAYRGLVPMAKTEAVLGKEKANNRHMYLGHGGHVLTFPVGKGMMMNVVAFADSQSDTWEGEWIQPLQHESMTRDFGHWGESVVKIMELIQGPDVWAIFEHPEVPSFHESRVCLLGDAAHATSPHFGQGAGMALEDAYVLSNLLGSCKSRDEIEKAFDAYDSVRVPRALKVTAMSRKQGELLDMKEEESGDDLEKIASSLNKEVRWIWDADLRAHLKEAVEVFEKSRS